MVYQDLLVCGTALIATGGTAIAALNMLTEWGLEQSQIKVVSVLGSKLGVKNVQDEFPNVEVSVAPGKQKQKVNLGIDLYRCRR